MSNDAPDKKPIIQLRRYPNRRYYDLTHSRHVTIEEIYRMILDGHDIQATDSKTDEDITARVLTQIISEHESPKLAIFPAELLHLIIRANEPLMREFVEKYFSQAFRAFMESQEQWNQYLRQAMGLQATGVPIADWPRAMFAPFSGTPFGGGLGFPQAFAAPRENTTDEADLRLQLKELRQQVAALQEMLNRP
jgi:polyhydroxyalkanoate synthesis repressor PhaR